MRLRFRLILSFVIMAILSIAFLIFQANLLFTRQLKTSAGRRSTGIRSDQ